MNFNNNNNNNNNNSSSSSNNNMASFSSYQTATIVTGSGKAKVFSCSLIFLVKSIPSIFCDINKYKYEYN